jgi:predicted PolB exonuclease-like 3'-5' exonuclease
MLALSSDGLDRSPPGKNGISGAEIEKLYRDSRIREIAEYCESDAVNTYRVWLRYELFRGRLSDERFHGSKACLTDFIKARANTKPHLAGLRVFHWPPWSR